MKTMALTFQFMVYSRPLQILLSAHTYILSKYIKTTGRDLGFRCKDWIWNQDSVHWKFGFSLLFNLDRVCNWAAAKQDGDQFKADEEFSSQVLKSTWEFRNKNSHYWHITFKTTHSQVINETHQDQQFQECPHESLHNQRRHLSTVPGLWFFCLLWPGQGRIGEEWSRWCSMSTAQCSMLTMLASQ